MFGGNKERSKKSIAKAAVGKAEKAAGAGYGGHFRAVQGFKYIGIKSNE